MKSIFVCVYFLVLSISTFAQTKPAHVSKKKVLVLDSVSMTAAIADAKSTRYWITQKTPPYVSAKEEDPLMRPFAHSWLMYPVQLGYTGSMAFIAHKMRHSDHVWKRKLWWVPQVAQCIGSGVSAKQNYTNRIVP